MENNLTYTRNGDYLIPDLSLSEQPKKPLGKYGRMRKAYLKEHRPLIYNHLLMSEKLYPHLLEIEETANSRLEQMIAPAGGVGGRDGGAESPRSDALGGADEHLQGTGRGDSDGGAYQQLTLNLFLSEAEQIQRIDEAENVKTSSAFSFTHGQPQPEAADQEAEAAKPTLRELHEKYKPIVLEAVTQDTRYRNTCGHSDHESAVIEGRSAIQRAVLASGNKELLNLYSHTPEFRQRLHREVIDETYPKLHELLRPLSDNDIDRAIQDWNGKIESKHAVVRYMKKHGREKDTAAWLAP